MAQKRASDSKDTETIPTAEYLELILHRILSRIRAQDWTHPDWEEYMAEDFIAYAPSAFLEPQIVHSRAAYIQCYKEFMLKNEGYDIIPTRVSATVDPSGDSAEVWIVVDIHGDPMPIHRESVTVVTCERRNGRWIAVRQVNMRGPPT